jgi:multiple sugar transport system ATP-binding protein
MAARFGLILLHRRFRADSTHEAQWGSPVASVGLEHVSCSFYARRQVVRAVVDLSLEVAAGEYVVLLGPSGCGKTTTLRLIAGLETPTEGTIRIDGRVANRVAPKDRDVAMVFQNYALYPHMTVFKNLGFGLRMRRTPKPEIRRRVAEIARRLDIVGLLDRRPGSLSGGERQRVALGRAIVRNPRLFLFDEPLSNLDVSLRLRARTDLGTLHRELKATVLHVTHDQEEAMALGDRIAVLREGRLQQCGSPQEIYRRPANRFVAGFVGTPPMNMIPGKLEQDNGRVMFTAGFGSLELPSSSRVASFERGRSEVVLGLRPQHVTILEGAGVTNGKSVLHGCRVTHVEPLGDCVNVHAVSSDGTRWTARGPADFALGSSATDVGLNLSNAHVFAGDEAGKRLN